MFDRIQRVADRVIPVALRGKLRFRARFTPLLRIFPAYRVWEKRQAELEFWVKVFDQRLREGHFWMHDVESLLDEFGEWPSLQSTEQLDYETLRWMEGRALVFRVLKEARLNDTSFFTGKTVVDIGPGPMGLLEACDARVKIAIEPLAKEFQEYGLLIPSKDTVYLPISAESLPLLDETVDVVIARNSLDHVENPGQVVAEVFRVLVPEGVFILNVDLNHKPTVWEPHSFTVEGIHQLIVGFETLNEYVSADGQRRSLPNLVGVYRKPDRS